MTYPPSVDPINYLSDARMGKRYLDATNILLASKELEEPDELERLSLGPLMFLIGHSTELLLKSLLFSEGEEKVNRKPKTWKLSHDLDDLFSLFLGTRDNDKFWESMDKHIFEIINGRNPDNLETLPTENPLAEGYHAHLVNLNLNYNRPFMVRYPKAGVVKISSPRLLVAGTDFLWKLVDDKSKKYFANNSNGNVG